MKKTCSVFLAMSAVVELFNYLSKDVPDVKTCAIPPWVLMQEKWVEFWNEISRLPDPDVCDPRFYEEVVHMMQFDSCDPTHSLPPQIVLADAKTMLNEMLIFLGGAVGLFLTVTLFRSIKEFIIMMRQEKQKKQDFSSNFKEFCSFSSTGSAFSVSSWTTIPRHPPNKCDWIVNLEVLLLFNMFIAFVVSGVYYGHFVYFGEHQTAEWRHLIFQKVTETMTEMIEPFAFDVLEAITGMESMAGNIGSYIFVADSKVRPFSLLVLGCIIIPLVCIQVLSCTWYEAGVQTAVWIILWLFKQLFSSEFFVIQNQERQKRNQELNNQQKQFRRQESLRDVQHRTDENNHQMEVSRLENSLDRNNRQKQELKRELEETKNRNAYLENQLKFVQAKVVIQNGNST